MTPNNLKFLRKKFQFFTCFFILFIFFSKLSFAQTQGYMSYDDFLFDAEMMLDSDVKVQLPIFSLDIPTRTVQVDLQNVAVDVSQIDRKIIKDINTLCNGTGANCYLDVEGTLNNNPEMFPPYLISANDANLWFLVGVAVSEGGIAYIGIDEQSAINDILEITNGTQGYVSGFDWIDTTGTFAVAYAVGVSEFFAGWGFNPDYDLAIAEAVENCDSQITGLMNFSVKCEPLVFNVPWW